MGRLDAQLGNQIVPSLEEQLVAANAARFGETAEADTAAFPDNDPTAYMTSIVNMDTSEIPEEYEDYYYYL